MEYYPVCVGCGYCCTKTKCAMAVVKYGSEEKRCPALYWDEEKQRYFCKDYVEEVWLREFGLGCTSSLNTWRREVKKREAL